MKVCIDTDSAALKMDMYTIKYEYDRELNKKLSF